MMMSKLSELELKIDKNLNKFFSEINNSNSKNYVGLAKKNSINGALMKYVSHIGQERRRNGYIEKIILRINQYPPLRNSGRDIMIECYSCLLFSIGRTDLNKEKNYT
jgi:hypothetical protein